MNVIPLPLTAKKAVVLEQLQKELLSLQGLRSVVSTTSVDTGLGPVTGAFPNFTFPLGAIHEFIASGAEDAAATSGFVSAVVNKLMDKDGVALWISASRTLFPPALMSFGINPEKIIFLDLQKEKELLWAMEEALKCGALAAVIGEIRELGFTASRRLQLAVEESKVTGFILRNSPRQINTTACVTRWKITSLASQPEDDLPGIGFPGWNVELLKIRNGKPGTWQLQWQDNKFVSSENQAGLIPEPQVKTA